MSKPSVIIIGAGAAGLIAAQKLSSLYKVTILEAQPRTGGRIHSISDLGGTIEAGAEFVHGNLPVTLGLLKEAGISFVKVQGEMYRYKDGHLNTVEEMTAGWDGLLEKMQKAGPDMTMLELLDKYYPGPENESLRRQVKSYSEGFDLADITRASVKSLYTEWDAEDGENYRVPAGYTALIQYLQQQSEAGGVEIFTGKLIQEVRWGGGTVTVHAATGEKYTADKLLVTVAVSTLHQPLSKTHILFTPALPFEQNTADQVGFGTVIKAVLKFKKAFWPADAGFILSDEIFPTWWTQLPDEVPLLTGWMGGPKASSYSNEPDDALIEKALASIAAIFGRTTSEIKNDLEHAMVFNWQKNDYAMGAYSYDTIHSEKAKEIIMTPSAATVFFAGEAWYTGDHPGTVEAALVSGINAAELIKNSANHG